MTASETIKITLTQKHPVRILDVDWPVVASSSASWQQTNNNPNAEADWSLNVRQHADGRKIVYGLYKFNTNYRGERHYKVRGGEMVAAESDVPAAIAAVGEWMADQEHHSDDASRWKTLVNECTGDLPAVTL